jgi:arsenite methyltransferase
MNSDLDVREAVRDKYSQAALRVSENGKSCCGASSELANCSPITSNLYDSSETAVLPEQAVLASLGCGNPTALANLDPGETVLDLGSGGGIDVLLSARRVGPTGKAYGLDMTNEMLALARENQRKAGVQNVEFLKGEIENIPLPDNSIDVIISNCVINLSGDKDRVLSEAFRVLKPGGRFAVSDVVTRGEVPSQIRKDVLLWVGCIAGALQDVDYIAKLETAGFKQITIEPTRVYDVEDARQFLTTKGVDVDAIAAEVSGKFMSAFVRAVKPRAAFAKSGGDTTDTDAAPNPGRHFTLMGMGFHLGHSVGLLMATDTAKRVPDPARRDLDARRTPAGLMHAVKGVLADIQELGGLFFGQQCLIRQIAEVGVDASAVRSCSSATSVAIVGDAHVSWPSSSAVSSRY